MKKSPLLAAALALSWALAAHAHAQPAIPQSGVSTPINGLIYLINTDAEAQVDGLLKWEQELKARGLTAMIKASNPVLDTYPEVFKRLASEGHEIIGGYAGICWDMPYEDQYQAMKSVKDRMEDLTGRPMQVFVCTYSSYDENTVRAAEALGVPYVLARGTEDVRALIYQPAGYTVGIIEVSNVEFAEMGKGSLCDISLYSRGATEEDFARVFKESVAKAPDSMILVSHPHIGGTKVGYWQVYEEALGLPALQWRTFADWLTHVAVVSLPYAQIPENREVEYLEPKPAVPLEQLANLPEVGNKIVMFHNGQGPMCKDAKAFIDGLKYPVEEHLSTEKQFLTLLDRYRVQHPKSEGVSDSYEYYPIIFLKDRAFSGFDDEVRKAIEGEIGR
jgi:peptidoglycan/xylan/chitin deacetylase (PgdA/CDA1 family)